tara:strand:+ start:1533 stop:2114 length:582 start_codon:yes stop_codon:yes gene_type:complete
VQKKYKTIMANKNKDYSIADANKILEDFQKLSGVDPLILSQKPIDAYFRALLYKVLMDFNYMNDRQIEDFFWSKRIKRTRVAVYHAIRKIDLYYHNYSDFRNVYNIYFDDKIEEFKLLDNKIKGRAEELDNRVKGILPKKQNDALQLLINSLPAYKRDEVYEMVNLRVKSWAWKSKDKCEVIESSDGVTSSAW